MVSRAYCVHVYGSGGNTLVRACCKCVYGSGGNIGVGVWWVELIVYMCMGLVVTLG